jgi:hypothetical protein
MLPPEENILGYASRGADILFDWKVLVVVARLIVIAGPITYIIYRRNCKGKTPEGVAVHFI